MSRRRGPAPGRRAGAERIGAPRPGAPGARDAARLFAVAAIACAALAAVWALRGTARRSAGGTDPIASLSAESAYVCAVESTMAGRSLASLPYYRRAERAAPADIRVLHWNLASALYHSGFETRAGGSPAMRSSVERVALMREALVEMQRAHALPGTPQERAASLDEFADMMHAWGLPWEAFTLYNQAEAAEPTDHRHVVRVNAFRWILEHPEVPEPEPAARIAP
jgi:hypothetical protein